ncbi:MAG: ECF transporter S component [Bacillota bacterium]|jgi:riboflavin transporter FmnP
MTHSENHSDLKRLALVGVLAAMSLVLELFVHFPLLPSADFLLYSPGDVPIILAAVLIGPAAGLTAAFINASLFVLLTGKGGPWGALMHFASSGGMALVIGWVSRKTDKRWIPMIAGVATRVILMVPLNMLITPIYTGASSSVVMKMIVPAIIPFNFIHAGINTILSCIVMKVLPSKVLDQFRRTV